MPKQPIKIIIVKHIKSKDIIEIIEYKTTGFSPSTPWMIQQS